MFVAKQAGDAWIELCIYRLHNLHTGTLSLLSLLQNQTRLNHEFGV